MIGRGKWGIKITGQNHADFLNGVAKQIIHKRLLTIIFYN